MTQKTRYRNVRELVRDVGDDKDFADALDKRLGRRRLVKRLFALRNAGGLSQKDVADRLGCTQSRVSKLENCGDDDWRLGDLVAYADALGLDVRVVLSRKEMSVVGQVKHHAFAIKRLLDQLADLAADDEMIARGVSAFFGETFFKLVEILQDSAGKLPPRMRDSEPLIQVELEEPCFSGR